MLNLTANDLKQFAYCPRRMHLMYVQGRWNDNAYTTEGKNVHRRIDRLDHVLPDPQTEDSGAEEHGEAPPDIARSIPLVHATRFILDQEDSENSFPTELSPNEIASDTGELGWYDAAMKHGMVRVDTPGTCGLIGFKEKREG